MLGTRMTQIYGETRIHPLKIAANTYENNGITHLDSTYETKETLWLILIYNIIAISALFFVVAVFITLTQRFVVVHF
jgi:hypothetical protein